MIRRAILQDLEGILSLIRLNPDTFTEFEVPVAAQKIRQLIKRRDRYNQFFVVIQRDEIVGCAGFTKQVDTTGVFSLTWLAVHPAFKRRGIATKLYFFIESKLKRAGGRLIILNAGSHEANRFFYKKVGFIVSGEIPEYYSQTKDLVWYYKNI